MLLIFAVSMVLFATGCGDEALVCYVGGTMRPAIEELAKMYEAKTGVRVNTDVNDSGALLARIELVRQGDLYVAHDPFLAATFIKGHAVKGWGVASLTPVIVVPKGNPKNITGFKDLARPGLKLVLTDETRSTAGWVVPVIAKKAGITDATKHRDDGGNVVTRTRGGHAAADQVVLGHADAAVVWNAVAKPREKDLDAIPIEPEFAPTRDVDILTSASLGRTDLDYIRVTICTLKYSKNLKQATAFAEFCASPEAAEVWKRLGFSPADPARDATFLKEYNAQ